MKIDYKEFLKELNFNKEELRSLLKILGLNTDKLKTCDFYLEKVEVEVFYKVIYCRISCNCGEWLVFRDLDDAEDYAEWLLINNFEDFTGVTIPPELEGYFNFGEWAEDVVRFEGIGAILGSYDGNYYEIGEKILVRIN